MSDCSSHSKRFTRAAQVSASRPNRRGCWSAITRCSAARGPACRRRPEAALKEIAEPGDPRNDVRARMCSRTSKLVRCCRSRGRPPGPAGFRARGRAGRCHRARSERPRRDAWPFQRRAVPAILRAARSAREGVPRLDRARRPGGATDNKPVIAEMTALRDERARLLGYQSFAHYKLDDTMAKTPAAVTGLLDAVWTPARRRVGQERDALQEMAAAEGGNFRIAPWDWRYYAEKAAQGALRSRRERDQAVPAARQASSRRRSTRRTGCSGSPSRRARTCRSITRTCASGR